MLAGDLNIYEPQHRNGRSRFVVSLQLRHPDAIAELRMELPRILAASEDDMEEHYQQIRTSADPTTFREYATGSNLMLPGRLQLYMLQAVMDNRLGGRWLNDLRWSTLGVSKAAYTLLTSDWPLHLNANGEGMVLLPLSPRTLFIASPDNEMAERFSRRPADEIVKVINNYVASSARRYVFASDEQQTRFIQNRMSTKMRSTPLFPLVARADRTNAKGS
jgi:Protein of unknown function (DUF4238)